MMHRILIEVITPMITNLEIGCRGCGLILDDMGLKGPERETCAEAYPVEWKETMDRLAACLKEVRELYRDRVRVRLIDAQSPMGLWKKIRHRISTYPAWIMDNGAVYAGWDSREVKSLIEMRIVSMREHHEARHPA